jgi:hypothetical protein
MTVMEKKLAEIAIKPLGREFKDFSISSYTLKAEDVFSNIHDTLHDYIPIDIVRDFNKAKNHRDEDEMSYILWEKLFNWLQDIAPEGSVFGAHPGDDSNDFGFWDSSLFE